jgi:hypothetical protein
MRARRYALLLAVCAVAGCGGSGSKAPTAAEIEAAQNRWRAAVDEVCFELNRSFGERGRPAEVATLGRTVADGVAEVRAGIRKAVAVPLAKGGSRAPAAFMRELKGVDAELAALSGGGANLKPVALVQAADRLRPRLRQLEIRAGQSGLTNCMTHTEYELVPDAVRSPIFLKRLRRHDRRFVQRLPEYDEPASTSTELAERMEGLGELLDFAVADAATFDPPSDAAKATRIYRASVRRLLAVARRFEAFARGGGATASPAGLRRHQRAFTRAWRKASRAEARMRSRARMPPTPDDDADDPDAEQS